MQVLRIENNCVLQIMKAITQKEACFVAFWNNKKEVTIRQGDLSD